MAARSPAPTPDTPPRAGVRGESAFKEQVPPRASSRLDLLVIPAGEQAPVQATIVAAALGGDWIAHDEAKARFLCNERGGFRVACPNSGQPAARAFSQALQAWREGGPRNGACACGETHDLGDFSFVPPAAFAASWVQLVNAPSAVLMEATSVNISAFWPNYRVLWVRP